jgi:hypothetical protein
MGTPDHEPKLDYSFIADGIYVGTNACCTDHLAKMLGDEGITVDISLESERLDQPFGVEAYLWLPTEDHASPSPDQLKMGVVFIAQAVALHKKIYAHCKNGHGRAPTLVAAYFIAHGKTADEAVALLKTKRPSIHLQDSQVGSLRRFAEIGIR